MQEVNYELVYKLREERLRQKLANPESFSKDIGIEERVAIEVYEALENAIKTGDFEIHRDLLLYEIRDNAYFAFDELANEKTIENIHDWLFNDGKYLNEQLEWLYDDYICYLKATKNDLDEEDDEYEEELDYSTFVEDFFGTGDVRAAFVLMQSVSQKILYKLRGALGISDKEVVNNTDAKALLSLLSNRYDLEQSEVVKDFDLEQYAKEHRQKIKWVI